MFHYIELFCTNRKEEVVNYMMNKYIILNNAGWYADRILTKIPGYQGIDRFVWPLSDEDESRIQSLQNEEKDIAEQYMKEIIGYMSDNDSIFCYSEKIIFQYMSLCELLGINVDLFVCEYGIDIQKEKKMLMIDNKQYIFQGYDYVLKNSTYSCLIHEKSLVDEIEKIQLNSNGLLNSLEDVRKFAELREIAKHKNDGVGFELGSGGVDFFALSMFKYQK